MKAKLIILGIVVLLFLTGLWYDSRLRPQKVSLPAAGSTQLLSESGQWKPAPDVSFETIEGRKIALEEFQGKLVLLNFWATWCPPCVKEFPALVKLIKSFEGQIVLVAVSSDDTVENIHDFLSHLDRDVKGELNNPYLHIVLDHNRIITQDVFHTERYPETILITKKGKMARKFVGEVDWNSPGIVDYLKAMIKINE